MGLAAPRYCCCLGSFPTVADARSSLLWTKAAPGLTIAPASPRALQTTAQTRGAHVFSLNLKPNMFTWAAVATFMYTTMWAELAKLIHWCHLDEPQWCDGYYIITHLYKNCWLMGTKKCYMELWAFWFLLIYLEQVTITDFWNESHFAGFLL